MSNLSRALVISIAIHILICISLGFIKVRIGFAEPEFVEVGLLAYTPPEKVSTGEKYSGEIQKGDIVELPEAKHPEEKEKIVTSPIKEVVPLPTPVVPGEKETPQPASIGLKGKPYLIEGDISKRRLIYQVLPEYPGGYNIETDVRVEVFVAPSGKVTKTYLLKKGGDVFDRATLDAIREWRFEKLPPRLPQEVQKGIVTFMYRLR